MKNKIVLIVGIIFLLGFVIAGEPPMSRGSYHILNLSDGYGYFGKICIGGSCSLDLEEEFNVIGDGNFTGDLIIGGNQTLGQKIVFSFGEIIDNIVDGWVRIVGNLNVTGNITPSLNNTFSLGSPDLLWKDLYLGNSSIYLGNYILDVLDGNFRIRNGTTNIMYFNQTANEMVFTTNTRTIGFAEGDSPLKLREGVQFFNVAGAKGFSIYHAHGNEEWRNVSDIFNASVVFELDEKDNPYGMDWIVWDKLTQRPPLVINFGEEGRATTFDRSLRIGKANSPVDENFTLCTTLACNSSDVADLEVEGSIWAGRNFIGSGLMKLNMSGGYGIGVGTLSLIGGSKTTHYGGIGGGGGKISLQGGRGRDSANNPSSYAPILLQSNGGNVGIGTTSPDRLFEVFGSAPVFRFRDSGATASATTAFIEFGGTDGGDWNRTGYIGDGSSGDTHIRLRAEDSDLYLGDSSGEQVLVLSGGDATFSGNVGIGTTSPTHELNVIGITNSTLGFSVMDNVGYSGFCVNTTYLGGIAISCND